MQPFTAGDAPVFWRTARIGELLVAQALQVGEAARAGRVDQPLLGGLLLAVVASRQEDAHERQDG